MTNTILLYYANDAFAKKVKNVFTELGEVRNQEVLDSYMQTYFSSEEDLQRATVYAG
ncbi:MAG: hypothetical protein LBG15_05810 [Dysgonamonadaceae bacterium]|nr:hypothetical protein [Dysgonamonadaceae bacterium]